MHRLVYFAVPGRGEASRVALALSDLEWEDVEVNGDQFRSMQENGEPVSYTHLTLPTTLSV